MSGYKKQVSYSFEVRGDHFTIEDHSEGFVVIEETRKNGQEDDHVYAEFNLVDGKWVHDCPEENKKWDNLINGYGKEYVDAIAEHLKTHGIPCESNTDRWAT